MISSFIFVKKIELQKNVMKPQDAETKVYQKKKTVVSNFDIFQKRIFCLKEIEIVSKMASLILPRKKNYFLSL